MDGIRKLTRNEEITLINSDDFEKFKEYVEKFTLCEAALNALQTSGKQEWIDYYFKPDGTPPYRPT